MDQELKNFAVFSHFEGATRYEGKEEGDISVVLVPEGWWWVIPLRNNRTSVGLVGPSRMVRGQKPDEAYFAAQIAQAPNFCASRLANAGKIAPCAACPITRTSAEGSRGIASCWSATPQPSSIPCFPRRVYLGMVGAFRAAEAV